jgi:hypothetical protein
MLRHVCRWYRTQGVATISPFGSKRVKVTYNNADEPGERMFAIMFGNTEHQNDAVNALRAIGAEIGVVSMRHLKMQNCTKRTSWCLSHAEIVVGRDGVQPILAK